LELIAIHREEGISAKIPLKKRPEGSKLVAEYSGPKNSDQAIS